jgi:hypothetical protein
MKRYQQDQYGDMREREDGKYYLVSEVRVEIGALKSEVSRLHKGWTEANIELCNVETAMSMEIATLTADLAYWKDIAANRVAVNIENDALKERLRELCTISTVEMMCENESVRSHVEEWEKRCLKAEANIEKVQDSYKKGMELYLQMESQNQRLREALEKIASTCFIPDCHTCPGGVSPNCESVEIAREAIKEEGNGKAAI